jgi:hypothetical protein
MTFQIARCFSLAIALIAVSATAAQAKEASHPKFGFTIEKQQEIEGSNTGFTASALAAKTGQTVDYRIIVTNTGKRALTFGNFTDAKCEGIAGGPTGSVSAGQSTTFTCHHVLSEVGTYTNSATITGSEGTGTKTSNTVEVTVAEERHFHASGSLTLSNATFGQIACPAVEFAGSLEGAGVGKLQTFAARECSSPTQTCVVLGGTATELIAEGLPWNAEIVKSETGVSRLRLGSKGTEPGHVTLTVDCVGANRFPFVGEVSPLILNNGSELEFGPESGELENSQFGKGILSGKFKVEGTAL